MTPEPKIKIIDPAENREAADPAEFPPFVTAEEKAEIIEKINNPPDTTTMTGAMMAIKLAVRPSFLPDSSDITALACYFVAA
jgi:hypothetical protein